MNDLSLEQSEARRLAAEADATQLRAELAAKADSERIAAAEARLAESVATGGLIGELRRNAAQMRQQIEEMQSRQDRTHGENGVDANGESIRARGEPSKEGSTANLPSKLTYFVEAGITNRYRVYMVRV